MNMRESADSEGTNMDDRALRDLWSFQLSLMDKLTAGNITVKELQMLFEIGMAIDKENSRRFLQVQEDLSQLRTQLSEDADILESFLHEYGMASEYHVYSKAQREKQHCNAILN